MRAHSYRRKESTSHFRLVVRTFTTIRDEGQPWRKPPTAEGPGDLEGLAQLLVHGPEGRAHAQDSAQL